MNQGPQSELQLAELIARTCLEPDFPEDALAALSSLSASSPSADYLLIEALEGAPLQAARACFPPCAVCGVDPEDTSTRRPDSTRDPVLL
ncbi:hypothetical protein ABIA32_001528 [Streptacidiphilus sp. MAP12-20]|uniref:hypothetical protein n=1 Tax=Streptacidiphilus sp. MAP12-20 TaxID=3156299 RepID=UPI00351113B1